MSKADDPTAVLGEEKTSDNRELQDSDCASDPA